MARISPVLALTLALFGCTTATSMPAATVEDDSIAIDVYVTSMGWPREQWFAMAHGPAQLSVAVDVADVPSRWVSRRGTISPQDFARLRSVMAPLRRFIGVDLPCQDRVDIAPSVSVRWLRADVTGADWITFYTGCGDTLERREISATLDEADRLFHEATGLGQH